MLTAPTPAKRSSSSAKTSVSARVPARVPVDGGRVAPMVVRSDGPPTAVSDFGPDRAGVPIPRCSLRPGAGPGAGSTVPGERRRGLRAPTGQTGHTPEVPESRLDHGDAGVGVVDPVDRDLMDAQTDPLRGDQDLGVEEPLVVLHQREHLGCRFAAHGLEAALGIRARAPEGERSSRL